jgi:hypothetical protein
MAETTGDRRHPSRAYAASAVATAGLLWRRELVHPRTHVGRPLLFADGTRSVVYRETVRVGQATSEPTLLVVRFRLRLLGRNPLLHAAFRVESMANTPLFAGFAGFRSKLWCTDLATGFYRGVYQWNNGVLARNYAQTLCPLLAALSDPGTVSYHVEPATWRDEFLRRPPTPVADSATDGWWRAHIDVAA